MSESSDSTNSPWRTDDDVPDAVAEAIAESQFDRVTAGDVATHTTLSTSRLQDRLRDLARDGRLEQTWSLRTPRARAYALTEGADDA